MYQYFFRLILKCLGWQLIDQTLLNTNNHISSIVVFPHTTNWDFVMFLLYSLAYPNLLKYTYIIVKPQLFLYDIVGNLLTKLGCIPATRAEDSNNGFINKMCDKFENKNDKNKNTTYHIMISPEGKRLACEWKSGYYHLAQKLKLPIRICGFDYCDKYLYLGLELIKNNIHIEDVERDAKEIMSQLIPLYPNNTVVKLRSYDINRVTLCNVSLVTEILTYLLCFFCIDDIRLLITGGFVGSINLYYYDNCNKNINELKRRLNHGFISYYIWRFIFFGLYTSLFHIYLIMITTIIYYMNNDNNTVNKNSNMVNYNMKEKYNIVFNLLLGITLSYPYL